MTIPSVEDRLKYLLIAIGKPGVCRGCGATIMWVTHANGKQVPYTMQGLNHFIDCPKADNFRRELR